VGNFNAATALSPAGPGEFDVLLDEQWSIGTKLHGGYLLAVAARAAGEVATHPHLSAISGIFPLAPSPGPAVAQVEVLRVGTSATQLRTRLTQNGKVFLEALVTQGELVDGDSWWSGLEEADVPAEEDCVRMTRVSPDGSFQLPLMDVVETRLDPRAMQTPGKGAIGGWHRLADGSDWDPLSLLVALDPVPPISFDLGVPGWAPTLQMSAYLRRLPAPGPVKVRMHANDVTGNRMDETALAWDSKGRLVAQATQLAAVRLPRTGSHRS
jgi:hypothetical protein